MYLFDRTRLGEIEKRTNPIKSHKGQDVGESHNRPRPETTRHIVENFITSILKERHIAFEMPQNITIKEVHLV